MGISRPPGLSIQDPSFGKDLLCALIAKGRPGLPLADERVEERAGVRPAERVDKRADEKTAERVDKRVEEKIAERVDKRVEDRVEERADGRAKCGCHILAISRLPCAPSLETAICARFRAVPNRTAMEWPGGSDSMPESNRAKLPLLGDGGADKAKKIRELPAAPRC